MNLTHTGITILASFVASVVECVEALTVILAIGSIRGWRSALSGTAMALLVLFIIVVIFGQSLSDIPLPTIQLVVGTLLLMFGLRWLRKAILREAGCIATRDEVANFKNETNSLMSKDKETNRVFDQLFDQLGFLSAFKIVMLEGIEVVFIVIAIGTSSKSIIPASIGALAALVLVALLGLLLHRPLSKIPENSLKFGVGVLLAAFGTFWVGEGIHINWPGEDLAAIGLILAYFILALFLTLWCKKHGEIHMNIVKQQTSESSVRLVTAKILGLFIDDGCLAAGITLWVLISYFSFRHMTLMMEAKSIIFFIGFAIFLTYSLVHAIQNTDKN